MIALVAVSGKIFFRKVSTVNDEFWHERTIALGVVCLADTGTFPLVDVLHEVVLSH